MYLDAAWAETNSKNDQRLMVPGRATKSVTNGNAPKKKGGC